MSTMRLTAAAVVGAGSRLRGGLGRDGVLELVVDDVETLEDREDLLEVDRARPDALLDLVDGLLARELEGLGDGGSNAR